MSISEDMLVDRLKGHTYVMSHYQYMEVREHVDPEMMYIVTESIYNFMKSIDSNSYKLYQLFRKIYSIVVQTICEREKFNDTSSINYSRIENKMFKVYDSICKETDSAHTIINTLLPYIINDTLIQIRYIRG